MHAEKHVNLIGPDIDLDDYDYFEEPEAPELGPEALWAFTRQQAIIANFEEHYRDPLLRNHQLNAMEGYLDLLTHSDKTTRCYALLHAPGAGKTIWAAVAANAMGVGQDLGTGQPVRALFLGPERRILAQAAGTETLTKKGFALAAPNIAVSDFSVLDPTNLPDVTTMTYDMFRIEMKKPIAERTINFDLFDVVFYDECHSALGPETLPLVRELQQNKINIGMTGSPELENGKNIQELWPEIIDEIGLREGIEGLGILNSMIVYTLKTGEVITSTGSGENFSDEDLKTLMDNKLIAASTVRLIRLLASHNAKSIVFGFKGDNSKYARDLADMLAADMITDRATGEERHIRAEAIGSFRNKLASDEDNQTIFDAADRGDVDVITSVKMGEVGWDPLNANCIILACPTRSARVMIQRIGRGLRIQDQPTIIIHFDYEVVSGKAPKTPHEIIGRPPSKKGTAVLNPDDIEKFAGHPDLDLSDDPDVVRQLQCYLQRKKNVQPDDQSERPPKSQKHEAFSHLLQELTGFIDEVAIQVKERRAYKRNESQQAPSDHFDLSDVGKMVKISVPQLVRLLRVSSAPAYSLGNKDEQRFFCTPEAMEFLEARVAHPHERTVQGIAADFGCTERVVITIAKRLDVYDKRRKALRRDDLPKEEQLELLFFNEDHVKLVMGELHRVAIPILPSETPLVTVMEATGRSRKAVLNYLENRHNLEPTLRRVGATGRSGTLCMPTSLVNTAIKDLREIPPLPENYKDTYLTMNEACNSSFFKNRGLVRQDVEAVITKIGLPVQLFKHSSGHSSEFMHRDDLERLQTHVMSQPPSAKEMSERFRLPLNTIIQIAGAVTINHETTKSFIQITEEIHNLTVQEWVRVSRAIVIAMKELRIARVEPATAKKVEQNAQRILARIVMKTEPELAAIVQQDHVKATRSQAQVELQQAVKAYNHERVHDAADKPQTVASVALALDIKPAVLLQIMKTSYRPKNGETRAIAVNGKTETILSKPYREGLVTYVADMKKRGYIGNASIA